MKESYAVKFLYKTIVGRCCLKLLTRPCVSKYCGLFLDSRASSWLIPLFIRWNHIDMRFYHDGPYLTFNEFFTRKRESAFLPQMKGQFVSPCDGWLSIHTIDSDKTFRIKNALYDLKQLLRDPALAEKYTNGLCLIFRLTPQHYHRYNYVCDGSTSTTKKINGILHCVRPIVYENHAVYTENCRTYEVIHSSKYGDVVQMEVGALMVGKICNHVHNPQVKCAEEKGYFSFGGSTIILLIQKDKITLDEAFNKAFFEEIAIRQNDILGRKEE